MTTYIDFNVDFGTFNWDEFFVGNNNTNVHFVAWAIGRCACLNENNMTVVIDDDITFFFEGKSTSSNNGQFTSANREFLWQSQCDLASCTYNFDYRREFSLEQPTNLVLRKLCFGYVVDRRPIQI